MAVSTRVVLSDISSILDHRIQILEDVLYRLNTTSQTLRDFLKSKPVEVTVELVDASEDNAEVSAKDSESSVFEESILSSSKLDDILQRAKSIRKGLAKSGSTPSSSSGKKGKEASTKPVSLSSYIKSSTGSSTKNTGSVSAADDASVASTASRKPPVPPSSSQVSPRRTIVPPPPSAVYSFHADILSQLDYFRTHSPSSLNPLLKLSVTKELYVAQSRRLTKAMGRPTHPQSMCYAVIRKSVTNSPKAETVTTQECSSSVNTVVVRLKESFQSLQKHFERHLKSRLERTSLSQLSSSDREEVLLLWLKSQKLLQLYEHYCFRAKQKLRKPSAASSSRSMLSNADVCLCETCRTNRQNHQDLAQLVQTLLNSTAYFCPLTAIPDNQNPTAVSAQPSSAKSVKVPKGVPAGLSEPEQLWYLSNKRAVTAFHNGFDNNVKFLVESVCGQNELTQVVTALKECSRSEISSRTAEKVLSTGSGGSGESNARWIEGLKMFKNVHCILTTEAQDDSTCVFLHKQG